jgi:hypothetical protein
MTMLSRDLRENEKGAFQLKRAKWRLRDREEERGDSRKSGSSTRTKGDICAANDQGSRASSQSPPNEKTRVETDFKCFGDMKT